MNTPELPAEDLQRVRVAMDEVMPATVAGERAEMLVGLRALLDSKEE